MVEGEADGIDRVVRDGKRLHVDVFDGESRSGLELPHVGVQRQFFFAKHLGGEAGAVDRDGRFFAEHAQSAHVVGVLVGEEDSIEHRRFDSHRCEPRGDLFGA